MMEFPKNRAEIVDMVKRRGWTAALALMALLVAWQGLTLFGYVQSWGLLEDKVRLALAGGGVREAKPTPNPSPERRQIEATFFHRPQPNYSLSAIFDDRAVVNGKEVRVGERVEKAVVEKIGIGSITIREDGSNDPREIVMHPG